MKNRMLNDIPGCAELTFDEMQNIEGGWGPIVVLGVIGCAWAVYDAGAYLYKRYGG